MDVFPGTTGIIMCPMIFGPSKSFRTFASQLSQLGYRVSTIDYFPHRTPFYLRHVVGIGAPRRLRDLVNTIDEEAVFDQIARSARNLQYEQGCSRIILMGFGLGGDFAIKAAQLIQPKGVVAWYPQLAADPGSTLAAPDIAEVCCPTLLFFGADSASAASLAIAAQRNPSALVEVMAGTGYAFAEQFIQWWFPNPQFNKKAALDAWAIALRWMNDL